MADSDTCDSSNAELDLDTILSVDFSDFVKACVFPQCVCVTSGSFLSRGVQISSGDILQLKSFDRGQVTLSYRTDSSHSWTEVSVDLNYPQKFIVLPPKERDANADNRASMVMYPTIADLMLDCPTYFEATSSYDDPYLPAMSVKLGDRFWFVQIVRNSKEGVDRLKVRGESGNILFLSLECRGHFCPLKDDNEYTVKELVELASVPRRLQMVTKEARCDEGEKEKVKEDELTANEYTAVVKSSNKPNVSASSSFSSMSSQEGLGVTSPSCLPSSFSGIVNLLKHESAVAVSPYNDPETTWTIPVSANLTVRTYSQDDYEVPTPLNHHLPETRVPLPISHNNEVPKFRAPSTPPLQQPLVPINISSFVDIYCSTFPVRAKVLDISEAHPFLQAKLRNTDEVIVYRLDETRRLYVKDINSDVVYSLSRDLKLSFIEYPEKFRTVSELLHLPVGTEITVLEDIAADFPKPFSLRLGDVIRLTSNTPYFIKMKHLTRDCQVIKCERVDSRGGEDTKLKLPMDLEVNMVMTVDSNSRRMIPLQDLITGAVDIPNQSVASVPVNSEDAVLKALPVDLRILKSMKETCIVVAPDTGRKSPSALSLKSCSSSDSVFSSKEKTAVRSSRQEQVLLTNVGLPLTSGVVLAFRHRLDLYDLDVKESEADYLRIPVEKMTVAQFEERERMRKLNSDYEDMEFGSNSTIDESGSRSASITRTNSAGVLDKKQKTSTKDKMLRLSRALNPKHWRHSKAEPEPLPHPSAMGLMALAARPKEDVLNEYHHTRVDSTSGRTELGSGELSSSEEEENFYEDVEIGPLRSSTIAATTARQTGAFSGPTHRSLPPPARTSDSRSRGVYDNTSHTSAASEMIEERTSRANSNTETHTYDVPKPFTKAKNWATNMGNNIGERFSSKHRYDVPKSCMVKEETVQTTKPSTAADKGPPDTKPPLPPHNINNKTIDLTEKKDIGSTPVAPARRKNRKSSSWVNNQTKDQNNEEEQEKPPTPSISKSISLNDSVSSTSESSGVPKPKPRSLKTPVSSEEFTSPILQSQVPKSRSADIVKSVEALSVDAHHSLASLEPSPFFVANNKSRPNPPPKPKASTHTTV